MNPNKKVIVMYVCGSTLVPAKGMTDIVSTEEFLLEMMSKTGQPRDNVRKVARAFFDYISQRVNETGEYLMECRGEYDVLFKKPRVAALLF
ncbi:MAG TPA: hypothetical protein VGA99_15480 [bacterium]